MKKSLLFTIVLTSLMHICEGQPDTIKHSFYNREFKWSIFLPPNYTALSNEQYNMLQKEGLKNIKKTPDENLSDTPERICAIKNGIFNYFEANKRPFDTNVNGNYLKSFKSEVDEVYKIHQKQIFNDDKIDTTISREVIDGLEFQRFKLLINFRNKTAMNMYVYSKLFDRKEFTVTIIYVNRQQGDLILNSWKSSKFDKN